MPVCLFADVRVCLQSASFDCPPAPSPAPQQDENMSLSHLLRFPLEQCPKTGKCHCPSNYQSVCEVCAIVGVCSAGSKIGVPCDLSSAFAPGQGGCIIPDNSTVIVHICWHVNERIAPQTLPRRYCLVGVWGALCPLAEYANVHSARVLSNSPTPTENTVSEQDGGTGENDSSNSSQAGGGSLCVALEAMSCPASLCKSWRCQVYFAHRV